MARLGDVCDILNGFAFKSEQYVEEGIRIIRIANVQKGYIEDSTPVFYPIDNKDAKKYSLEEDDMLMSLTGNVGRVAKLSKEFLPAALNQRVACLRIKDGVALDKAFLFNLLNSDYFEQQCIAASKGVAQKNMSTEWLKEYEIPMFSLTQQKTIASVLDKVTELIALRKEQLAKLDELVKSRFIELFVDKDFSKTTIGELVASKVSSVKKVFLPTDTIKYIDISSIDNKRNIMTGFTEYILEDAPSRAQQHIKKGDIVVSTVRPNLKNVAITGYDYDNLVASSGFCVLRAEKCLPSYLMAVVCSDDFTDAMTKVVTGANYPAIKDSDVKNYVIPNPPVELQEQFAAFVEQTDKSKLAIQASLEKLETLKKALMQKYFG